MKNVYLLIIIICLSSCVAKKTKIEYKERIQRDTISVFQDRIVIKPVNDTLVVESPCDSLGNLKDFDKVIKTEIADIKLINDKGNIKVSVKIDSIVNERVEKFKKSFEKEVDQVEVEIVKFRYPIWMILSIIGLTGISILLVCLNIKNIQLPFFKDN